MICNQDVITSLLVGVIIGAVSSIGPTVRLFAADEGSARKKIPVIYDSDIGDDIDDTWALAVLLKSPELDLKLVVGDQGRTEYRTKLFAKLLETAKRTDVPIGLGVDVKQHRGTGGQHDWVAKYDLTSYPGKIHEDGVGAIIDTIMNSTEQVTLIAVGPLPNIREALEREPRIASKARFVGMHGSVRKGYGGKPEVSAEYNVKQDAKACQIALSAPWSVTITPLDTCGVVSLRGAKFARMRACDDPLVRAILENYDVWAQNTPWFAEQKINVQQQSSTLYDTVAVYLAFTEELCEIETLPIRVTDAGKTVIDATAKKLRVATTWKDLSAFEELLVRRLTGE